MPGKYYLPEGCLAFEKMLQEELVGETHAKVFSLKKNKPSHSFLSGPHVFPCCLSPFGENNCIQLKFNVFYGPISMKERCGAPLF